MMRPSSKTPLQSSVAAHNPFVSVIIPVFNLENYLAETVDSVLGQSFQNFEIILVDDGSTDHSREIIAGYHARMPEMVKAVFLDHGGASAARNTGIAMARGEWIAFLDGDDIWQPSKLAEQLQLAKADPQCNFVACAANVYGQERLFQIIPAQPFDFKMELLRSGCVITLPTVLIRRELLAAIRFNEKLEGAQDVDLFLRLADSSRLAIIRTPLVSVRIREEGISGLLGGHFLQLHRYFQMARQELLKTQRENPRRIRPYAGEIYSALQQLAHEAAYYALMNPRASIGFRLRLVAIAIAERPGRAKNYRLLLQALLPAALNRRLVSLMHPPSS